MGAQAGGFVAGRGYSAAAAGAIEFDFMWRLGRPAVLLALILSVFFFWNSWYAAVIHLNHCRGAGATVQFWRAALLPPGLVLRRGADGRADLNQLWKRRDGSGGRSVGAAARSRRRSSCERDGECPAQSSVVTFLVLVRLTLARVAGSAARRVKTPRHRAEQ